jgi:transcriptional regulator with XRE-family HTH domain
MGERIRAARQAARMSLDQLAGELGISKTTVSKWENNVMRPRVDQLPELRRVLDTSVDHLIGVEPSASARSARATRDGAGHLVDGPLTPAESDLLAVWRSMSPEQQNALLVVLKPPRGASAVKRPAKAST